MKQFKEMIPSKITVIRNGKETIVKGEDVVLGDVIKINLGDRLAADLIIIVSNGIMVEQSAITGEADQIPLFAQS